MRAPCRWRRTWEGPGPHATANRLRGIGRNGLGVAKAAGARSSVRWASDACGTVPVLAGCQASQGPRVQSAEPRPQEVLPSELPGLVLLSAVVFPDDVQSVQLDRVRSMRLVEGGSEKAPLLGCFYPSD